MTMYEALSVSAMEGVKVRHKYFDPEEWLQIMADGNVLFEDGNRRTVDDFVRYRTDSYWQDGWSVHE